MKLKQFKHEVCNFTMALDSFRGIVCTNAPIIHEISDFIRIFEEEWAQVPIHAPLENQGSIGQSECHNLRDICAKRGLEGGFLRIFRLNENVVVASTDIKFGEKPFSLEFVKLNLDIWHGIMVFDGDVV